MIAYLIFILFYSINDALNDKFQIENNQNYHTTGFINRVLIFTIIAYLSYNPIITNSFKDIIFIVFIGASLYWIIFDYALNLWRGLPLNHRGSVLMDKLWGLKPFCLIFTFVLLYNYFSK